MVGRQMVRALGALAALTAPAAAGILFDNGGVITNPTGGTGSILGQPISQPERLARPGDGMLVTTSLGRLARGPLGQGLADDFTVPAAGWDLDSLTVYGFELRTTNPPLTTPSIDRIHVNLWTSTPFSANSPGPLPNPLPQPVSAQRLVLPIESHELIGYRTGGSTATTSIGTIFALTVRLDDLLDGGGLAAGTYWMEWGYEDTTRPNASLSTPLVTPRTLAPNLNARQFNFIDGAATENSWFEARDGFVAGVSDGLAMAYPFKLHGTVLPEPGALAALVSLIFVRRRRL